MPLSFEREVKAWIHCRDMGKYSENLRNKCKYKSSVVQKDYYFRHPCRNFAETDEAVRVRVEKQKERITLTYKGPRVRDKVKKREEINVGLGIEQLDPLLLFLERNGYTVVALIEKKREIFDCMGLEISLDTVEKLGCFVEAEAKKPVADPLEALKMLGVTQNLTDKTYLEMILEKEERG